MDKIIVLNHKSSLLYDEVYKYIEKTNKLNTKNNIIICPSYIYLESFINNSFWPIGAQDLDYNLDSDHTSYISIDQLKSLGVEYSIIGHSETKFNSDDIINLKLKRALDSNIIPILCVGEEKNSNFEEEMKKKLDNYLKDINYIEFIIFAYEPIYMIGKNKKLDIEKLTKKIKLLEDELLSRYNVKPRIIYGGSVDDTNIEDILKIGNINGVIIGSKSSDYESLENIIKKIDLKK